MPLQEVTIPDIGGYKNVSVIELNVSVGDQITAEQALMVLETDKATMDIPSPVAGQVKEILVKLGSKVSQGSLVMKVQVEGAEKEAPVAEKKAASASQSTPATAHSVAAPVVEETTDTGDASLYASPAVRRLAREIGMNLAQVVGSGRKGRITKEDLKAFNAERRWAFQLYGSR
jgi:pyruvate dehydrogenase E2 component (dihydrolipoamide acetyltransferase)